MAQVYITQHNPSIRRPIKELKGFKKTFLQPGEEKRVTVEMEIKYAASFWDEAKAMWIVERDGYDVLVGSSSALPGDGLAFPGDSAGGKVLRGSFELEETWWWRGL